MGRVLCILRVSILVLLDFVLKASFIYLRTCCYWVSILVLLDFVLKEEVAEIGGLESILFQSLFYWILFLRFGQPGPFYYRQFVSILVLLDFVLKVSTTAFVTLFSGVSILVLLDFVLKAVDDERVVQHLPCFNPCFIGFCS